MKKGLQVCFLVFILSTVIIVNIRATLDNYYGFYYSGEKGKVNTIKLYNLLSFVEENKIYRDFNTYTGLETGYGFFAPNVASEYVIEFTLYNKQDSIIENSDMIPVKNKETIIRISSAYSMFLNYKPGDTSNIENLKCMILLKGIAHAYLKQISNAVKIKADLYLFHYPFLEQIKKGKARIPVYYLYASKTYTISDYKDWE